MKRALIIFALACAFSGCKKVTVTATDGKTTIKSVRPLSDDEKVKLLRDEAGKRHLHWKIICTAYYEGDPDEYLGVAAWTEQSLHVSYEDQGKTDEWMESGNDQANVALALYYTIQGPPTHPVSRWGQRPKPREGREKTCKKPPLHSEEP